MTQGDFSARLVERCGALDVAVTEAQLDQLWRYYELLGKWNQRTNLTALNLSELSAATIDRLIVEPLSAKVAIPEYVDGAWVDLGSGGGSPAIPLKIVLHHLKLTMTESRSRKAAFLREAARAVGLSGVHVVSDRFETLRSQSRGSVQLVTTRAVRLDSSVVSLVRDLLVPNGIFVSFGHREQEVPKGFRAISRKTVPCSDFVVLAKI